jgi:hypothetical protein
MTDTVRTGRCSLQFFRGGSKFQVNIGKTAFCNKPQSGETPLDVGVYKHDLEKNLIGGRRCERKRFLAVNYLCFEDISLSYRAFQLKSRSTCATAYNCIQLDLFSFARLRMVGYMNVFESQNVKHTNNNIGP